MNNYLSSSIVGGLGLICFTLILITGWTLRNANRRAMRAWKRTVEKAQAENKRIDIEATRNLCYADGLEQERDRLLGENAQLQADNELLGSAVVDLNEKLRKSVDHATKPLVQAKTPPKRPTRSKKEIAKVEKVASNEASQ